MVEAMVSGKVFWMSGQNEEGDFYLAIRISVYVSKGAHIDAVATARVKGFLFEDMKRCMEKSWKVVLRSQTVLPAIYAPDVPLLEGDEKLCHLLYPEKMYI